MRRFYWTKTELDEAKAWAKKTLKNLNIVDTLQPDNPELIKPDWCPDKKI